MIHFDLYTAPGPRQGRIPDRGIPGRTFTLDVLPEVLAAAVGEASIAVAVLAEVGAVAAALVENGNE